MPPRKPVIPDQRAALILGYGLVHSLGKALSELRWLLYGPIEQRLDPQRYRQPEVVGLGVGRDAQDHRRHERFFQPPGGQAGGHGGEARGVRVLQALRERVGLRPHALFGENDERQRLVNRVEVGRVGVRENVVSPEQEHGSNRVHRAGDLVRLIRSDRACRRLETFMNHRDGRKEYAVARHCKINSRCRHNKGRKTTEHCDNNDEREDQSTCPSKQNFAGLRCESFT